MLRAPGKRCIHHTSNLLGIYRRLSPILAVVSIHLFLGRLGRVDSASGARARRKGNASEMLLVYGDSALLTVVFWVLLTVLVLLLLPVPEAILVYSIPPRGVGGFFVVANVSFFISSAHPGARNYFFFLIVSPGYSVIP
jgi:hypothetical protein